MSEMKRCKSRHIKHGGEVLQCEGLEGHASAHFCDDTWWANEKGLPVIAGISNRALTWFGFLVVFVITAAVVIFWLVTR